jgi:mannosyl-oligosaccharide alpha-1,2-mannosidase
MYRTALATFSKHLIFRPSLPGDPDILFSGAVSTRTGKPKLTPQVQHLGCFVGGMVALGAKLTNSMGDLETAGKLTDGCVWAYNNTPTGIMPEVFNVKECVDPTSCIWDGDSDKNGFQSMVDPSYQLRPEAIESVFVMYRLTGDPSWQEKGWRMFEAIVNHTTTDIANAKITDVMASNPQTADSMESFWLAETLKYFYLLFSEPDLVSLDDFVLNTEAHPLKWDRVL